MIGLIVLAFAIPGSEEFREMADGLKQIAHALRSKDK